MSLLAKALPLSATITKGGPKMENTCVINASRVSEAVVDFTGLYRVLSRHHFSMADGGGHVGGETMFRQLRAHYWWAGMERECHSFAAACEKCGST